MIDRLWIWGLTLALCVGVAIFVIVVYSRYKSKKENTSLTRQEGFRLLARLESAISHGYSSLWDDRTVQLTAAAIIYFIALAVVWINSANPTVPARTDYAALFSYYSIVFVVLLWLTLPLANSIQEFIRAGAWFGILLVVMLEFVVYRNRVTFWAAFALVVSFGFPYLESHFKKKESFFKAFIQGVIILLILLSALHLAAEYILLLPADYFSSFMDALVQVRIILVTVLFVITLIANALNVLPRFSWKFYESKEIEVSSFLRPIVQSLANAFNMLFNFLENVGNFVTAVFREFWSFFKEVFFDLDLYLTVGRIAKVAIFSFFIAWIVVTAEYHAVVVLRSPSVFASFFLPPASILDSGIIKPVVALCWSNAYLSISFLALILFVRQLASTWSIRFLDRKIALAQQILQASVVVFFCIWLATVTYFYPVSFILGLNSEYSWVPGIYTLLVIPLTLYFQYRSSKSDILDRVKSKPRPSMIDPN